MRSLSGIGTGQGAGRKAKNAKSRAQKVSSKE